MYDRPQFHTGVDFAGGSTAIASASGTVLEVRSRVGYGLTVVLDHGDGVATTYSHLARASVAPGQAISRGQAIGAVGESGAVIRFGLGRPTTDADIDFAIDRVTTVVKSLRRAMAAT